MSERQDLLAKIGTYYTSALERHGPTARGVDWNSEESQRLRFEKLALLWSSDAAAISVLDYGCGYGALVPFLRGEGRDFTYRGYDISPAMIALARRLHPEGEFFIENASLQPADYVVASGIFNVKLDADDEVWREYVFETLARLRELARKGFAFNALTSYSDADKRRPDLYYADPLVLFDHCKRRFSPRVALLHDYPLYEFTMLVRL